MKIQGKSVLITGACSGIGKIMARRCLEKGAKEVIIWDINEEAIAATVKELSALGKVYGHKADISSPESVEAAYEATRAACGPVDILINNAGVQGSDEIDVNLKGTIAITEHYGIHEGIRSVLMIGSASAHTGSEFPEYAASKGGLLANTKNVALRIASYGATCNSLDFGGVMTELNRPVMEDPALWAQIMAVTPLKRWMTVREAAEWSYFMTVTNRFCTGQNILIDGLEAGGAHFVWPE